MRVVNCCLGPRPGCAKASASFADFEHKPPIVLADREREIVNSSTCTERVFQIFEVDDIELTFNGARLYVV